MFHHPTLAGKSTPIKTYLTYVKPPPPPPLLHRSMAALCGLLCQTLGVILFVTLSSDTASVGGRLL